MSIWDKSDEIVMASHGKRADGEPRTCQVCGKEPNAIKQLHAGERAPRFLHQRA